MAAHFITTTKGLKDPALLDKRTGVVDNDNEHTEWVEYCLPRCSGQAHQIGTPDAPGHFCSQHVHRSVNMTLKSSAFGAGVAASF